MLAPTARHVTRKPYIHGRRVRTGMLAPAGVLVWFGLACTGAAIAADLDEAEKLFRSGRYDECGALVDREIARAASEPWHRLKIKTELVRGKDTEAISAVEAALGEYSESVPLHLLGWEVYRQNGRADAAEGELDAIERLIRTAPRRYATAEGLVAIGRYYLLRGADARKVLDQ